ncbi:MAG: polyprenol monophosphomannose synthase [Deltaproteobacteria bacterium]|nr:polyprenol monophosphomannose synthase [Deltaproteobacteria bacterium]
MSSALSDDPNQRAVTEGAGALICIPTYDERENLEGIVRAVLAEVPRANILVVDDNSPDGTGEIADRLAKEDARVIVLHRPGKEGLGRAYLDAFRFGIERGYEYIFEMDADFSHDPRYLPRLLEAFADADVVIGSRRVPGGGVVDWGPFRRAISQGGSLYARIVLGVEVRDLTGGFNGFRRRVLESIGLEGFETSGYGFQIELKYRCLRAGFRVVELPIVFPDRKKGRSKMSSAIFLEAMTNVLKLRFGKK